MEIRSKKCTVKGQSVDPTKAPEGAPTEERLKDGQHADHYVLCPEDRAKGRVRPLRTEYTHVGVRPKYPTRPLTEEELDRHHNSDYACYEEYPEGSPERESGRTGRFWTAAALSSGCGTSTTMPMACAETYAVDPTFYGSTFCCYCQEYFKVGEYGEFVWKGTDERVGT